MKKSLSVKFFGFYCSLFLSCSAIFGQTLRPMDIKNAESFSTLPLAEEKSLNKCELTPEDVTAFFDGLIPLQIEQANIAGAVVALVKDGSLLFVKGYGYADVAEKLPISAQTTLFRPGSISKLFIWTAVMQQVEQGKLDLDGDVNNYLDFKIPQAFDKPITLRNIMTHRAGFEETLKDVFVSSPEELIPLSQYLQSHMPARIFPPGEIPAYSNYATTLAAYIVERVSGQSFNDYVQEHIFQPLGMKNSTFQQPLPDPFKAAMSKGYMLACDEPKPFEVVQVAPAGALSASAVDMARFMIMHLQNGRYEKARILKPETAMQMHARQAGWPEAMNAMCLGFYEQKQNGYRIIAHEGNTILFHSNLFLLLDANTGLFISYNSAGHSVLDPHGSIVLSKFMDRYFPDISEQIPTQPLKPQDVQSLVGSYMPSRRSETTFLALSSLLQEKTVHFNVQDNTLSMVGPGLNGSNQQPLHFRQIAPLLFQEVGGKAKLAFAEDGSGHRLAHIDYGMHYPSLVFQQVNNTFKTKGFNFFVLSFSLSVIFLTLLSWPFACVMRKYYEKPLRLMPHEKRQRAAVHLACLSIVAYILGLVVFVHRVSQDFSILSQRGDLWLRLLQSIGLIVGVGSLAVIYHNICCWLDKRRWLWGKMWNTCQSIACLGFFWFISYWNLLDLHLKY